VNTPLRRLGKAHVLWGSHSFTCTPRVHPLTEWTIPVFAFPAEAGIHLATNICYCARCIYNTAQNSSNTDVWTEKSWPPEFGCPHFDVLNCRSAVEYKVVQ